MAVMENVENVEEAAEVVATGVKAIQKVEDAGIHVSTGVKAAVGFVILGTGVLIGWLTRGAVDKKKKANKAEKEYATLEATEVATEVDGEYYETVQPEETQMNGD